MAATYVRALITKKKKKSGIPSRTPSSRVAEWILRILPNAMRNSRIELGRRFVSDEARSGIRFIRYSASPIYHYYEQSRLARLSRCDALFSKSAISVYAKRCSTADANSHLLHSKSKRESEKRTFGRWRGEERERREIAWNADERTDSFTKARRAGGGKGENSSSVLTLPSIGGWESTNVVARGAGVSHVDVASVSSSWNVVFGRVLFFSARVCKISNRRSSR